jgi:peptide/nickel transport system substrate-binding protein
MSARSISRGLRAGAAIGVIAALGACGDGSGSPTNVADAKKNVQLVNTTEAATGQLAQAVWFLPKEPGNLDLTNDAANDQSDVVMTNVCEKLNKLNPDMSVTPGLASKYEWTTPTTLVFTLRGNVTFHDGSAMTVDDVLFSMKRNATEGNSEADEFVNVKSVAQSGPDQITFTMTQPDAVFVEALAGDAGVVQQRKAVETQGKGYGGPGSTIGCTGPFTLSEWKPGQQVVLKKAAQYWDSAHAAKTDQITFKWGSDDAIANSLLTGAAQGAYLENIALGARLSKTDGITVAQGPSTRVWSLMATERGGLTDPQLRKALSLAIDRDGINRAGLFGLGQPWKEPVGSGAWGYEKDTFQAAYDNLAGSPDKPSDADITEAKKLVTAAGNTTPIVVSSDGSPVRNVLANAVVDAARKIGLEASIVQIPTAQYGDFYDNVDLRKKADLFADDYFISKMDPVGFYKTAPPPPRSSGCSRTRPTTSWSRTAGPRSTRSSARGSPSRWRGGGPTPCRGSAWCRAPARSPCPRR